MTDDEYRVLRRRQAEARDLIDRRNPPTTGNASMLGTIYNGGAMPTALPGMFKVHPTSVSATEAEGATIAGSAVGGSASFLVVGSKVPPVGSILRGHLDQGRWVAEWQGKGTPTGTGIVFGCPCTNMPNTLQVHRANPPSPGVDSTLMDATLVYGARPSDLSLYASDIPGYYSTSVLASTLTGYFKFRYWLACDQGFYSLRGLITPDSPVSYPGTFIICYFLAGLPGNTCSPFNMLNFSTQNNEYRLEGPTITS